MSFTDFTKKENCIDNSITGHYLWGLFLSLFTHFFITKNKVYIFFIGYILHFLYEVKDACQNYGIISLEQVTLFNRDFVDWDHNTFCNSFFDLLFYTAGYITYNFIDEEYNLDTLEIYQKCLIVFFILLIIIWYVFKKQINTYFLKKLNII